jgi:hypothetical protein
MNSPAGSATSAAAAVICQGGRMRRCVDAVAAALLAAATIVVGGDGRARDRRPHKVRVAHCSRLAAVDTRSAFPSRYRGSGIQLP